MSEMEKFLQVRKEAAATGVLLLALMAAWYFLGFALRDADEALFALPLWVIGGVFGTWALGVLGVRFLLSFVFRDMDLEEERHG